MSFLARRTRLATLWMAMTLPIAITSSARADIVLFTASTDNTGGAFPIGVPGTNNTNIPAIDPGVTLNPNPAFLDGDITYGLNGVDYGPFGFVSNTGGNTGWVHIAYTVTETSSYQFTWEVAGSDRKIRSAIAIDNVQVNGNVQYGFEAGIPGGFITNGTVGTSGSLTRTDPSLVPLDDFAPTEGTSFAYLDMSGGKTPIYDTVDSYTGSQLFSSVLHLSAGDTISLDMAFLTNEGDFFTDYGIATLRQVPEPSGLALLLAGLGTVSAARLWRRRGLSVA